MVIEVTHMPKVARNYQREDFSDACVDAASGGRTGIGGAAARTEKRKSSGTGIAGETAQRQPDEQPGNAVCLFLGREATS